MCGVPRGVEDRTHLAGLRRNSGIAMTRPPRLPHGRLQPSRQALAMARKKAAEMDFVDLYACFPCAPAIAARELGLPEKHWADGEKLSLIGGLM